jgi:hypothetical protein
MLADHSLRLDVFAIAPQGLPNQSASCLPLSADEPDIAGPVSPPVSCELSYRTRAGRAV